MEKYQLIVIGGGPGGYVAAIRAAQLGMRVALIEKDKLGGTCLNRGCMPTKALLHSSSLYAETAHFDELGLSIENVGYDIHRLHGRKAKVVDTLRSGIAQLLKSNKIDVIAGEAQITAPDSVLVNGEQLSAERILVATGSTPSRPPIPGLELEGVVTSDEILEGEPKDYKSLIIIGGGVIGVEMASIYSNLGCKVTVIEALERIIPTMERDISQNLAMILKKRGVDIFASARVSEIQRADGGLTCVFEHKGAQASVSADGVLVSIGRRPNTANLFACDAPEMERGYIKVDESYESSVKGIYAVGDVIGGVMLAHKAEAEGMAAVELMLGHTPSTDPHLVPSCIYTQPEIACVGMSADDAKLAGIAVKKAKYLMGGNGKSVIEMQERGFIKVVFDESSDRLLGVQMMCARATDMISEFTSAILNNTTREQLLRGMRPHPTFCEGITEALEAVDGKSIHSL